MAQAKKAAGRSVKQEGSSSSGKKAATAKKTAGTGRKATGKTTSGNRNQKKQGRQSKNKKENAIAKEIWILLFFAASVILFLSVLNLAGHWAMWNVCQMILHCVLKYLVKQDFCILERLTDSCLIKK